MSIEQVRNEFIKAYGQNIADALGVWNYVKPKVFKFGGYFSVIEDLFIDTPIDQWFDPIRFRRIMGDCLEYRTGTYSLKRNAIKIKFPDMDIVIKTSSKYLISIDITDSLSDYLVVYKEFGRLDEFQITVWCDGAMSFGGKTYSPANPKGKLWIEQDFLYGNINPLEKAQTSDSYRFLSRYLS